MALGNFLAVAFNNFLAMAFVFCLKEATLSFRQSYCRRNRSTSRTSVVLLRTRSRKDVIWAHRRSRLDFRTIQIQIQNFLATQIYIKNQCCFTQNQTRSRSRKDVIQAHRDVDLDQTFARYIDLEFPSYLDSVVLFVCSHPPVL